MNRRWFIVAVILSTLYAFALPTTESKADDPLNAFPTEEDSADDKVKRLCEAELQAIQVPVKRDQVVLSIATASPSEEPGKPPAEPEPWLLVFADGRINCGSLAPLQVSRRDDTLTESELLWLLHLAVNECRILSRSTEEIDEDYQAQQGKRPSKEEPQEEFRYQVQLPSGENDLTIPQRVLILRPLRAQMKLIAFASLHRYANFLVARAYLGNPRERQSLLEQLNERLKAADPNASPFRMEHLAGAVTSASVDLAALFQQEIALKENKYRKLTGHIMRKEKGMEPTFSIGAMEYTKYRPR